MRTLLVHLLNNLTKLTKRLDLQYNNLICLNISASSLLLLLNLTQPSCLIMSVYKMGKELICNDGNGKEFRSKCNIK